MIVSCVKADNNLAVIAASGIAEKKKDVYSMALKSIFNALFLNGIDGVENGRPLVGKEDSYYMNQFFNSRYMLFVKNYETVGEPVRQSSRLYKGTVTAQILLGALKKDLIRNKLMTRAHGGDVDGRNPATGCSCRPLWWFLIKVMTGARMPVS